MRGKVKDDCFAHAGRLMRHDEAIALLRERVQPVTETEPVPLSSALGRIVAETIIAPRSVPAHTNAAVDGYAFAYGDYDAAKGTSFTLAGRASAGHPVHKPVQPGHAIRILTGAPLPEELDTVAMQEDCTTTGSGAHVRVTVPPGLKRGANVRKAGEDAAAGEVLLEPGGILRPQDLAAVASVGLGEIQCRKRLRVAIVSTGDELVRPNGAPADSTQVYDANAPMLSALAALCGCETADLGIWPDRSDVVRTELKEAARRFDVVLTSGGASGSEEDHVAAAVAALGSRHFWQLAVKPGRPIMFGEIGGTVVIGLPGNPVAVFVCFLLYVWPVLRKLSGAPWLEPRRLRARAAFEFLGRKRGRREFWRGHMVERADGLFVDKFKRDGSGLISGLRAADVLIEIPEEAGDVRYGDEVAFIPLTEFGILAR
jgi:molybdopterin molybdotransferase